ncbi:uncharacterized protein B4U79_04125, partial [Dinothrombium tinctorium]
TDLIFGGPTCTVTSIIPGSPSPFTSSMQGICHSIISCRALAGIPIGRCPATNVCCVFPRTCDGKSSQNQTYFTNPAYPSPFNGTNSCALTIYKVASPFKICQLRLDFIDFELNRPVNGNCNTDRMVISGQNSNSIIPALCGYNTGQHSKKLNATKIIFLSFSILYTVYVDIDSTQGPYTIRIITEGPGYRRWNIQITQIECLNLSRAPQNCLQYNTGPSGTFSSFNYERLRMNEPSQTTGQRELEANYLNGLDYAICFRKEAGFCSQTYNTNSSSTNFEIVNIHADGTPVFNQNSAGAGVLKCRYDYLVLSGIRFCGNRLNIQGAQAANTQVTTDAPITVLRFSSLRQVLRYVLNEQKNHIYHNFYDEKYADTSSGPFIARFHSDYNMTGRGFRISYKQNPCGAIIPGLTIPT